MTTQETTDDIIGFGFVTEETKLSPYDQARRKALNKAQARVCFKPQETIKKFGDGRWGILHHTINYTTRKDPKTGAVEPVEVDGSRMVARGLKTRDDAVKYVRAWIKAGRRFNREGQTIH